ncbi:murein transglycosylase A [Peteryoungia desertarenae]|uniref:peptidoglycan lytic exotransglycosylase n=1 Tax=Peteryoungia desertarenae TaxID=1813451 RepID=A0ABX6QKS3_9HYPH|nr:murein transglycosylase A [Peteryoungia desertarenae]QLF68867.1 murein transglycosylase A [Peteryoungia desertarenae]
MSAPSADFRLKPTSFNELPGWQKDDPSDLLDVMADCLRYIEDVKPHRSGSLGLTSEDLVPLLRALKGIERTPDAVRRLFEQECKPFEILLPDGGSGFVTAFYEPEVTVAAKPGDGFLYPFYRRPDDLVDISGANRPQGWDYSYVFGRKTDQGVMPYPDRKAIDQGFLDGRGLEIAWANSRVDVFFAHVQGAARLRFPDGSLRRITYDGKAGHPFSGIGRYLIDLGEIAEEDISMQSIRLWLEEHPERQDEILWHNRSYIFFKEAAVSDERRGPIAAAKVPLVAGRSLAVDRLIHTFGFPFFIHAPELTRLDAGRPFARLMLALDTGSAIVGPARGDIFTGSGFRAGEMAGAVRNRANFYILIPNKAAARFG